MTYMRPTRSQIDLWPSLGLELDWDILYNYSKKSEQFLIPDDELLDVGVAYDASVHGYTGPLTTSFSQHLSRSDLHEIFNQTMQAINIPPRNEFNGGDLRGFGIQMVTQNSTADIREDAARAYYYPFLDRPNLPVMVNSTGRRILWSSDATQGQAMASAVEVRDQDGKTTTVFADHEVILSAGALRTPIILENSGVGNPDILTKQNIDVKIDLRSVGENMQDQATMSILAAYAGNETSFPAFVAHVSLHDLLGVNASAVYASTLAKLPEYASTIASHNGGASSAAAQQRLLKSQLDLLFASNTPTSEIVPAAIGNLAGAIFWLHQPFSRGGVHINATDVDRPVIDARTFELDIDGILNIATAKWVRKFMATPPFSQYLNMSAMIPSFETIPADAQDGVWLNWMKGVFEPNYHHLGTCAMLPRELGGVVDNDFKVYGTRNVRVVDLSVVPLQIAGHSTAPLYGISEWAAEKIKNDQ